MPQIKRVHLIAFVVSFAVIGSALLFMTRAAESVYSVKSGAWSDPSVWSDRAVPNEQQLAQIAAGHTVTYDMADSRVSGVSIAEGGVLAFSADKSTRLRTDANIVVNGTLRMKPSNSSVKQSIKFEDIDESRFVGGGMEVLASDVGMWVMGAGQLDLAGSPVTSWTRLGTSASKGASTIQLSTAPTGWKVGDRLAIAPTIPPSVDDGNFQQNVDHAKAYDEAAITAISGPNITLDQSLKFDHPKVAFKDWNGADVAYGAEVMNLTRNVEISGSSQAGASIFSPDKNGRAHILIRSSKPQSIKYVEIQYMGPRLKYTNEKGTVRTKGVLGRYSLHFHNSGDGARGSVVEGNSIHNGGSHSFVPHESNGVTIRANVSHNTVDSAYWWDMREPGSNEYPASRDILLDGNIASKVQADEGTDEGGRMTGFELASGDNARNTAINNVAVGVYDYKQIFNSSTVSGYSWAERTSEATGRVWNFSNNLSHNNGGAGLFVWQNSNQTTHLIEKFTSYQNGSYGIEHGAYSNYYQYRDITSYKERRGGIGNHAVTRKVNVTPDQAPNLRMENVRIDGGGLTKYGVDTPSHRLPAVDGSPTEYVNFTILGVTKAAFHENALANKSLIDIYNPNIAPGVNQLYIENGGTSATTYRFINMNGDQKVTTVKPLAVPGGVTIPEWNAKRISSVNAGDTSLPEIDITSPVNGATVPDQFTVTTDTRGSVGIVKVDFYINNSLVQTKTAPPYNFDFDLSKLKDKDKGNISVIAYDASGNRGHDYHNFYGDGVHDPGPPSDVDTELPFGKIDSPKQGAELSGTVKIKATATDNKAVKAVEFLVGGNVVGTDSNAPYEVNFDTKSVENGYYEIMVRVVDTADNEAVSDRLRVKIANAEPPPPPPTPKRGDFNKDGKVNVVDISLLVSRFNQRNTEYDLNGDGLITIVDVSIIIGLFEG